MRNYTLTILPIAIVAVLALSVYLMTRDSDRENHVRPHTESVNSRIGGTATAPSTVQTQQQAFPRAYAAVADDPCAWSYYFWGGALIVDTLKLEEGRTIVTRPSGHKVTGYIVDHDLWYPEVTLTVPKAITREEALQRIQPPYGTVVRWISGPNFYLVKPGCDKPAGQPVMPPR